MIDHVVQQPLEINMTESNETFVAQEKGQMTIVKPNILQRIIAVRNEVKYIQKDKEVDTGKGKYKAVTHDMVTSMTRDSMNKHGIVVVPYLIDESDVLPFPDAKQFRFRAVYDFAFCNADDPTDRVVTRVVSYAMDNADKAGGKLLSYGKKTAVLKIFEIETGEDDESRTADSFDVMPWVLQMEQCVTAESLMAIYAAAQAAAGDNDEATRAIIASCTAAKKRLAKTGGVANA
jgi:hypothetical protein